MEKLPGKAQQLHPNDYGEFQQFWNLHKRHEDQ
jgi:hypothetical protein